MKCNSMVLCYSMIVLGLGISANKQAGAMK